MTAKIAEEMPRTSQSDPRDCTHALPSATPFPTAPACSPVRVPRVELDEVRGQVRDRRVGEPERQDREQAVHRPGPGQLLPFNGGGEQRLPDAAGGHPGPGRPGPGSAGAGAGFQRQADGHGTLAARTPGPWRDLFALPSRPAFRPAGTPSPTTCTTSNSRTTQTTTRLGRARDETPAAILRVPTTARNAGRSDCLFGGPDLPTQVSIASRSADLVPGADCRLG
jgi:hypothetical protein